jgi:hypothetical protein
MSALADQTPAEIDGALFPLLASRWQAATQVVSYKQSIKEAEAGPSSHYRLKEMRAWVQECEAKVDELNEHIRPLLDEYSRRGGWSRFYLVPGGHLHESTGCSTCYPTTQFMLVAEASGSTGEDLIERYAQHVCSVCFPDAPTMLAYIRGIDAARKAQAERDADKCAAGPFDVDEVDGSYRMYRAWGRCRGCGQRVSVTSTGKARKHRRKAAPALHNAKEEPPSA